MRIIRGSCPAEEVASVASESAWVLPLLEMCDKLNRAMNFIFLFYNKLFVE